MCWSSRQREEQIRWIQRPHKLCTFGKPGRAAYVQSKTPPAPLPRDRSNTGIRRNQQGGPKPLCRQRDYSPAAAAGPPAVRRRDGAACGAQPPAERPRSAPRRAPSLLPPSFPPSRQAGGLKAAHDRHRAAAPVELRDNPPTALPDRPPPPLSWASDPRGGVRSSCTRGLTDVNRHLGLFKSINPPKRESRKFATRQSFYFQKEKKTFHRLYLRNLYTEKLLSTAPKKTNGDSAVQEVICMKNDAIYLPKI